MILPLSTFFSSSEPSGVTAMGKGGGKRLAFRCKEKSDVGPRTGSELDLPKTKSRYQHCVDRVERNSNFCLAGIEKKRKTQSAGLKPLREGTRALGIGIGQGWKKGSKHIDTG